MILLQILYQNNDKNVRNVAMCFFTCIKQVDPTKNTTKAQNGEKSKKSYISWFEPKFVLKDLNNMLGFSTKSCMKIGTFS